MTTRERYLEAIVAVQRLVLSRAAGTHFEALLPVLGRAAGADRVYFADVFPGPTGTTHAQVCTEWCQPGVDEDLHQPELHDIELERKDPPTYQALVRGEAFARTINEAIGQLQHFMELTGVRSILLLPVQVDGHLRGFFGFDNCREARAWSDDEVELLRTAAAAAAVEMERVGAEEQLLATLQRLKHHIEQSPLAVIEWDAEFRVVFWSHQAEHMFGWSAAEIVGKRWSDWPFVYAEDTAQVTETAASLIDGSRPHTICCNRNYTRAGRVIHCEWYNSAIRGIGGNVVSTLSLVLDVTERVRAEEEVRRALEQSAQAEKMAALGQMASGVAHDFNNALTVIIGKADLMLARHPLPDKAKATLENIRTAGLDAAATVRRMQEFVRTRATAPSLAIVSLNELAAESVELTRHRWADQALGRGAEIRVSVSRSSPVRVRVNPAEVRELLTNLIFNAVDAMPAGGTLSITIGTDDGRAWVRVADSGMGMDAETMRRCFEPFFTTKGVEGTGLGLAVSWSIARRQGGDLMVDSEPGVGTAFTLWLVLADASTAVDPVGSARSIPPKRILVIDDRPDVIGTVVGLLRQLDHQVESAMGGEEGLRYLQRGGFDLVVSDLGMPGIDGREVARRAKRIAPQVPVILLTGWADELTDAGERPPGVDRIVGKPVTLARIKEVLVELFAAP